MKIRIDPEFQNVLPPLTEEEFKNLEELILKEGRVKIPIVVWNGTIVDGHHRWKIIQKHPEIPYEVEEKQFADKLEAFDWMYRNQLGRRNLTDEQRTCLLGKLYEARKHTRGGQIGNTNASKRRDQNDPFVYGTNGGISAQIAYEQNVSQATVKRAEKFAKGIDAIREEDSELAESILNAEKKVPMSVVRKVGMANPEERKRMISAIKSGNRISAIKSGNRISGIENVVNSMYGEVETEYTIENLMEQIRFNADTFIKILKNLIEDHRELCADEPEKVEATLEESIIARIDEIKKGMK